jgi:C-terminal processing protease CtpA/Prc
MQEARKSLIATAAVVAVIGATVGGGLVRNRMEVGPGVAVGGPITMESLVSSTDGIPDPSDAAKSPISVSTFFYQLTLLLEKEFVDGVKDEHALAIGAVRGMVNSLADSDSVFMKPEQMAAYNERRRGLFSGIGVEVRLVHNEDELRRFQDRTIGSDKPSPRQDPESGEDTEYDPLALIPTVVVTAVVPGGAADKAGMKAGDRILKVNGKWAVSSVEVEEIRDVQERFDRGEMDMAEFQRVMGAFRERYEFAMTPGRVADALLLEDSGSVDVSWRSASGEVFNAVLSKGRTKMSAVEERGGTIALRFFEGADTQIAAALGEGAVTLDLRHSTIGDFGTMRKCLALLAPNGRYGEIARDQAGSPRPFEVTGGAARERDVTLIVDESTWGAAAVFAAALQGRGLATLRGKLTPRLPWIETVSLPDGSGYTLRTGTFVAVNQ